MNIEAMKRKTVGIILGIMVVVACIVFFSFKGGNLFQKQQQQTGYEIVQKWEMPKELDEISGINWIGENRVAAVQDEDGILYIYNLSSSKIEKRIDFAPGGDYEGVAIHGGDAYVLRSDGVIFQIKKFQGSEPKVEKFVTHLTKIKNLDLEGLGVDSANNRLLLAEKEVEKNDNSFKRIFAFDLETNKVETEPLYILDLKDPTFKKVDEKTNEKFNPTEIGIHPKTGEIYIVDGRNPKLLITNKNAGPQQLYFLNTSEFNQPEALTFSPDGTLYISNEAGDEPANILKVNLEK